ncbi:hypothetical protein E2562_016397 [Oryza meyeriana var. granulata]|uniref:Uncharacterized protein n=1 Tax=Oryza meyeriana var. granulata TaxID=110450 RepID=A0A6G1EWW3_9ORYZ|nr:hypothetical protein E2562_016397 [Oryza meyeriana var. granulata]
MASAELTRLEHPVVDGAPLRLVVVGDWGRKGGYNQSRVAEQVSALHQHVRILKYFAKQVTTGEIDRRFFCMRSFIVSAGTVDFFFVDTTFQLKYIANLLKDFTGGGGSKAWRGIFRRQNEDKLQFFIYDGQGFLSLELNENRARFTFYDDYGQASYHWSLSKANQQQVQSSACVTEE